MSFLTIFNENNFLKTQVTKLDVIIALNKVLEQALILDDDTLDGDDGINDNDDENFNQNSNDSNDGYHLNDNNDDDQDNKNDNGNDDKTIIISQTMHFVEPFICEKAEFLVQIDRF